jgi:hypothetical protein
MRHIVRIARILKFRYTIPDRLFSSYKKIGKDAQELQRHNTRKKKLKTKPEEKCTGSANQ